MAAFLLLLLATRWQHSFEQTGPIGSLGVLTTATLTCAALLVLALKPGLIARLASAAWLRWLGVMSYGIYVFHILLRTSLNPLVLHLAHTQSRSGSRFFVTRFIVMAAATLAASWISYRFYELPFLRLKRNFPTHAAIPGTPSA